MPWCRSTDTVVFSNALWADQRRNRINGCHNSFFCWFIWLLVCRFGRSSSYFVKYVFSLFFCVCVCDLLWWINGPKNSERMCTFHFAWNGNAQQQQQQKIAYNIKMKCIHFLSAQQKPFHLFALVYYFGCTVKIIITIAHKSIKTNFYRKRVSIFNFFSVAFYLSVSFALLMYERRVCVR